MSRLDHDLLKTAESLLKGVSKKPRRSDLRRVISTAYYALFHALARMSADCFIGAPQEPHTERAWRDVYRSVSHRHVAKKCQEIANRGTAMGFPAEIVDFANQFDPIMRDRERADYDPLYKPTKANAIAVLNTVRLAIDMLSSADQIHRKAFAAFMICHDPKRS